MFPRKTTIQFIVRLAVCVFGLFHCSFPSGRSVKVALNIFCKNFFVGGDKLRFTTPEGHPGFQAETILKKKLKKKAYPPEV